MRSALLALIQSSYLCLTHNIYFKNWRAIRSALTRNMWQIRRVNLASMYTSLVVLCYHWMKSHLYIYWISKFGVCEPANCHLPLTMICISNVSWVFGHFGVAKCAIFENQLQFSNLKYTGNIKISSIVSW